MPLREPHPSQSFLSDFIFASQDGLVNVLGILLGITAATIDIKKIFVATLPALAEELICMYAVANTLERLCGSRVKRKRFQWLSLKKQGVY